MGGRHRQRRLASAEKYPKKWQWWPKFDKQNVITGSDYGNGRDGGGSRSTAGYEVVTVVPVHWLEEGQIQVAQSSSRTRCRKTLKMWEKSLKSNIRKFGLTWLNQSLPCGTIKILSNLWA